jgi:hypothetical protein
MHLRFQPILTSKTCNNWNLKLELNKKAQFLIKLILKKETRKTTTIWKTIQSKNNSNQKNKNQI